MGLRDSEAEWTDPLRRVGSSFHSAAHCGRFLHRESDLQSQPLLRRAHDGTSLQRVAVDFDERVGPGKQVDGHEKVCG